MNLARLEPCAGHAYTTGMPIPKRGHLDVNQLAKAIVDEATMEVFTPPSVKPPSSARAKEAGAMGGSARAKALPPKERTSIASKAAKVRWHGS